VEVLARQRVLDHADPAVLEDEEDAAGEDTDRHALEKPDRDRDAEDQDDDQVLEALQLAPSAVEPVEEEIEADEGDQSAEQELRQIGEQGRACEKHRPADDADGKANQPAPAAHTVRQHAAAEVLIAHHAADRGCQEIRQACRAQFTIQIHVLLDHQFKGGGVQQQSDHADQEDRANAWQLLKYDRPVGVRDHRQPQWQAAIPFGKGAQQPAACAQFGQPYTR
jgi:hypothetical protein